MNYADIEGLHLNGHFIPKSDFEKAAAESGDDFAREILQFAAEFTNGDATVAVQTSGSTGSPKTLWFQKEYLLNSAGSTINYFQLRPDDSALLCLPVRYIAGKLMVIRALAGKLQLHSSKPTSDVSTALKTGKFKFAPFTPMQISKLMDQNLLHLLENVELVLLGGAPVSSQLAKATKEVTAKVYHSYGMAETLTHVALRRINGAESSDWYIALPGVALAQDTRGCLVISKPDIGVQNLVTNDLVTLQGNCFLWQGRYDNLVNSGGVKLLPEQLEMKIRPIVPCEFFLAGVPDSLLGQRLVLFLEKADNIDQPAFTFQLEKLLDKKAYELPREVVLVPVFPRTESGKIKREELVLDYSRSPEAYSRFSV